MGLGMKIIDQLKDIKVLIVIVFFVMSCGQIKDDVRDVVREESTMIAVDAFQEGYFIGHVDTLQGKYDPEGRAEEFREGFNGN